MEREILERPAELDNFKNEIREWVSAELEKKKEWEERGETGQAYDPHADLIRPELLNETDMEIWKKLQNGSITNETMADYNRKFSEETSGEAPDVVQAREEFKAMIINKSIPIIVKHTQ